MNSQTFACIQSFPGLLTYMQISHTKYVFSFSCLASIVQRCQADYSQDSDEEYQTGRQTNRERLLCDLHWAVQGLGCDSNAAVSVSIFVGVFINWRCSVKSKFKLYPWNRHDFHKSCIDPWLLEHRTCPMCKMDILKHYGFVVGVPHNANSISNPISTTTTVSSTATSPTPPVVVVVNVLAPITDDTSSLNAHNTTTRIDLSPHAPNTSTTILPSSSSSSSSYGDSRSRSRTGSCDNSSIIDRESVPTSSHVADAVTELSVAATPVTSSDPQSMIPTESRQVTDVWK